MQKILKLAVILVLMIVTVLIVAAMIIGLRGGSDSSSDGPRPTFTPSALGRMGTWVEGDVWRLSVQHAFGVEEHTEARTSQVKDIPAMTKATIYLDVGLGVLGESETAPQLTEFLLRDGRGRTHRPENRAENRFFIGAVSPGYDREGRLVYSFEVETGDLDQLTFILGDPRSLDRLEIGLDRFYLVDQVDLYDAVAGGMVTLELSGQSLETISLAIRPELKLSLELKIEAGTILVPELEGLQDMVVRKDYNILVEPNLSLGLELEVACGDMHLAGPSGGEVYRVGKEQPPEDLILLLQEPGFQQAGFRLQQFAIWTITDNPSPTGFVGLGGIGSGTVPTDYEIAEIRTLFEAAGIDTEKYDALG